MLEVAVSRRQGDFRLEVAFEAPGQGIVALFGKSGAGKTSVIDMLAGLAQPERGRIAVDGATLFDSAAGVDLPPERRRLGYVFQEGRLFPHLDVRANLLYGFRRRLAAERPIGLDRVVELLGLGALLDRRPNNLSGGEKQRVAIGRALLANPRLLLMDEPLASLDAARKEEILPFIEQLRDLGVPIVYVSHDSAELLRLADTVVLMADGRVAATGPVEDILGRLDLRPLTGVHEAGAVLRARVARHDEAFQLTHLEFAGGELHVARIDLPVGTGVRVRVSARDVSLALEPPRGISIINVFRGSVVELAPGGGPHVDVRVDVGTPLWARVTRRSAHDLGLAPSLGVYVLVKGVAIDARSLGRT